MSTATRRRTTWAIAVSLLAHAVVLTVAALQSPTLFVPQEASGPPEPIIPILLMPRAPPPAPGVQAPSQIRLHQRAQRFPAPELPVAPLPAPVTPPTPVPPPTPGPVTVTPNPAAEIQRGEVRAALQGLVGCRDPDAARLTAAQRAKCDERLAAGAKDAPFLGTGVTAEKRRLLEAASAKKERDYKYRAAPPPPGSIFNLGLPLTAEDMANELGNDRPEAKARIPN